MIKIYVASKVKHADLWLGLRYSYNVTFSPIKIISTWIDEARNKQSPSLPDLWQRCVNEASECDVLLLYANPGEVLKGALVEVGAALGNKKPVYAVGPMEAFDGSWIHHHGITKFATLEEAIEQITKHPLYQAGV